MATSARLELIRSIKSRKNAQPFGQGIGLASTYIEALRPCLADQQCFAKMMAGVSAGQFDAACKSAASQLVYSHEECWEPKTEKALAIASGEQDMKSILSEVVGGSPELPKHCALVFRNIVTTNAEDRDRDILEPMGATVDKSMPLLWQHLQPQPIGKLLGIISQNSNILKVASCICDVNELASDSIKMVEAGILRISHGFKPKTFEPLPMKSGDQTPAGFHVLKYEVVEESLVSVPANSGAIIDAWATLVSRKSLQSDLVKALGDRIYDTRDTASQHRGFSVCELKEAKPQEITVKVVVENSTQKQSCTCDHNKSNAPAADLTGAPNPGVSPKPLAEDIAETIAAAEAAAAKAIGKCPMCGKGMDQTGTCVGCGYVTGKSLTTFFRNALGISETALIRTIRSKAPSGEEMVVIHHIPEGVKSVCEVPREIKLYAGIEGSYEEITSELGEQLYNFMVVQAMLGKVEYDRHDNWCYIEATMPDSVLVRVSGDGDCCYYKIQYEMIDGEPILSGDKPIIKVEPTIVLQESTDKTFVPSFSNMTLAELKKHLSVLSLTADHSDLKDLSEIADITNIAAKSIRSDYEACQLDRELSAILA
jgi:hypothetical protein